jgi:hypothetical protein
MFTTSDGTHDPAKSMFVNPDRTAVGECPGAAGVSGQEERVGERSHLLSGMVYLDPDE